MEKKISYIAEPENICNTVLKLTFSLPEYYTTQILH